MAGRWMPLGATPSFNVDTMLLLTDGTVLCQDSGTPHWWRLVPDAAGRYQQGTWKPASDGPNAPLYYASAVLRDGTVLVAGGEYNAGQQVDLCAAELYDPVADRWTTLPTPPGWTAIGDAVCCVLPDGSVLLGGIQDNRCALFDPATRTWSAAGSKRNQTSNEETWTLLPDGSVLTADCFGHPATERYVDGTWIDNGATPVDLVEDASKEIGPAVLLPDGRVFAIGASGRTALFTPNADRTRAGSWAVGPTFPLENDQQLGAKDAPAVLLPNGRVLCVGGPVDGTAGTYAGPTIFFEYDPKQGTLQRLPEQPASNATEPYRGRLLLLPTGEVLFSNGTRAVQIYLPDGSPDAAWAPSITAAPSILTAGGSHRLSGLQLNGLSQACSYGDDVAMATNYPIVRLRASGSASRVWYCRSFDHSTMAVATGRTPQSTSFEVPGTLTPGAYLLSVIANGIASAERPVTVTAAASGAGAAPTVSGEAGQDATAAKTATVVSAFYQRLTSANERIVKDVRFFFKCCIIAGTVLIVLSAAGGAAIDGTHWVSVGLRLVATGGLLSAAAFISGSFMGFLFGIPRSLSSASAMQAQTTTPEGAVHTVSVQPNTNLEQISDWLTKILVGVGLTQLTELKGFMIYVASALAPAFKPLFGGSLIGLSILMSFGLAGFIWTYFESRTSLMRVFGDDH